MVVDTASQLCIVSGTGVRHDYKFNHGRNSLPEQLGGTFSPNQGQSGWRPDVMGATGSHSDALLGEQDPTVVVASTPAYASYHARSDDYSTSARFDTSGKPSVHHSRPSGPAYGPTVSQSSIRWSDELEMLAKIYAAGARLRARLASMKLRCLLREREREYAEKGRWSTGRSPSSCGRDRSPLPQPCAQLSNSNGLAGDQAKHRERAEELCLFPVDNPLVNIARFRDHDTSCLQKPEVATTKRGKPCQVCPAKVQRPGQHALAYHLPWYWNPTVACWACCRSCGHKRNPQHPFDRYCPVGGQGAIFGPELETVWLQLMTSRLQVRKRGLIPILVWDPGGLPPSILCRGMSSSVEHALQLQPGVDAPEVICHWRMALAAVQLLSQGGCDEIIPFNREPACSWWSCGQRSRPPRVATASWAPA